MKKQPITPKGRIVTTLRRLWMTSREKAEAVRVHGRKCHRCGVKICTAKGREQKLEVHHVDGILNWDEIVKAIREQLLVTPDKLMLLCKECHKKE